MPSTHSQQIERWLGKDATENLSQTMRGWQGPPIAVAGVPGLVYATGDGDFIGKIRGGSFANVVDHSAEAIKRIFRGVRRGVKKMSRMETANIGFASLSDLISEATTGGKSQFLHFLKIALTATSSGNGTIHCNVGNLPAASGVGGTSGTGRACTSSTTGAMRFSNASAPDTTHITTITAQGTATSSLLLFDKLWDMTYNHATSTSTAVDSANRPTRYQTAALAPGNFITGEITTVLSATAHNLTFTYVDQDGNAAEAATAYAAPTSATAGRTATVAGQWFVPLNSPDNGVSYITNVAQSTITSVTGITTWMIGHPLALIPLPVANMPFIFDGINSAFSLERIYDNACLSLMTPMAATTGAITYSGNIRIVSG